MGASSLKTLVREFRATDFSFPLHRRTEVEALAQFFYFLRRLAADLYSSNVIEKERNITIDSYYCITRCKMAP